MTTGTKIEQERAQRLMAMGQMAASLAHEIRNPLGSMELFCTLLKKDLTEQPRLLQAAEQIHHGIRTLDRIISNCLQFTRDVVPRRKPVSDVNGYLNEVRAYVQPKADELHVALSVTSSGNGSISIDSYLMQQVLVNLLFNAVEAAGANAQVAPDARCTALTSEITDSVWTVTVSDTGCGMTAEEQRQMFDPFFTTKQGGTGLGLTIVHSIVRAHGGTIDVESTSGHGTRIILRIPAANIVDAAIDSAHRTADVQCGTGG
ncbi:MAG: ATP-binding protein [Bdellovibrionota bacterium]